MNWKIAQKVPQEIKNNFSHIIENYQTWLANTEYFFTPMPKIIS